MPAKKDDTKKDNTQQDQNSGAQEVDLNSLSAEDFEKVADALENEKKEKGLPKMPKDRSEDKRRVGKGLQKFIDVEVPEKYLEDMTEEIQELMKK